MGRVVRNPWTPREDERLAALWSEHSTAAVAAMMGRTFESVKSRARYIGLSTRYGTRRPARWRKAYAGLLAPLEWAPGQFATDARSYELITGRRLE